MEIENVRPSRWETVKRTQDQTRKAGEDLIIEVLPTNVTTGLKRKPISERVIRRLRGFVVSFEGETSRVVFIEGGERFLYSVPTSRLHQAGIRVENQPFEMDEMEVTTSTGAKLFGTSFQPLASSGEASIEPLGFDPDYVQKRNEVLNYFKDAST